MRSDEGARAYIPALRQKDTPADEQNGAKDDFQSAYDTLVILLGLPPVPLEDQVDVHQRLVDPPRAVLEREHPPPILTQGALNTPGVSPQGYIGGRARARRDASV
jgi:hypothetical protein